MEREPSIHVTRSVLIKLTRELGIKLSKPNIDRIMKAAREVSADNRTMIAKSNQTKKMKNMEGSLGDANLAAQIIYSIRVKLKHVGVLPLLFHQVIMCSIFNHPAVLKHGNVVTEACRGQPVRDVNRRFAPDHPVKALI